MTDTSFQSLSLSDQLLSNLSSLGYETMTPIQAASLPLILKGQDVIAQAKTGSGKTAAFGLGLLSNLNVKRFRVQTLVLCPTRELADQVAKEIRRLARAIHNIKVLTLCGGMPFGPQIGSLEHGAHIVVGTPGRIEEHLRKERLCLDELNTLVLDEADRMLDMGFQATVDAILEATPRERQTLLFSATYPPEIQAIADRVMKSPQVVSIAEPESQSTIEQRFFEVRDEEHRREAAMQLLFDNKPQSTIVFCNTKRECQDVADELRSHGIEALALHGDLEQRDRDRTWVRFSNRSASVLVATDVAARGLDMDDLDLVINYHVALDAEVHVHRIGRTGRAGQKGKAYTLFSGREIRKVRALEEEQNITVEESVLPEQDLDLAWFPKPEMSTIQIDGGKKNKLRPGDILGGLTGKSGIEGKQVGKINVFSTYAYVAVERSTVKVALQKLGGDKLKGRQFRVREIRGR